jgi:O-methyltransferase
MTRPTERDTSRFDPPPLEDWDEEQGRVRTAWWAPFFEPETLNEETVREVVLSSGYPEDRIHFVRGAVEETLPARAPDGLALLRLDTDWYESTRHELEHLYPRLEDGGVLIVDDYGHWEGCRRAVDEYFEREAPPVLLNRVDYTARIAVKH